MQLSNDFSNALVFASELHREQMRKGTQVPYMSHLMAVAGIVLEYGGTEIQAIAGLLHDAVEDQGGQPTLDRIRDKFGDRVADTVLACSDTDVTPKPPWRERKKAYLAHLKSAGPEVLLVSMADKLHNIRTILADYRQQGETLWERFSAGCDAQCWYYNRLADIFSDTGHHAALADELSCTVETLLLEIEEVQKPEKAMLIKQIIAMQNVPVEEARFIAAIELGEIAGDIVLINEDEYNRD